MVVGSSWLISAAGTMVGGFVQISSELTMVVVGTVSGAMVVVGSSLSPSILSKKDSNADFSVFRLSVVVVLVVVAVDVVKGSVVT